MQNTYQRIVNENNTFAKEYLNDVIFHYILSPEYRDNCGYECVIDVKKLYNYILKLPNNFKRNIPSPQLFMKLVEDLATAKVSIKEPDNNDKIIGYPFANMRKVFYSETEEYATVYIFTLNNWLFEHLKT